MGLFSPSSSGGSVATDALWDVKGDLAVGTGANTASLLAVGANTQVLTADSTQATGTKWAAPAGGGGGGFVTESTNGVKFDTGRVILLANDLNSDIYLDGGQIYLEASDHIYLNPNNAKAVIVDSGLGIILPRRGVASDPATFSEEGQVYYSQDSHTTRVWRRPSGTGPGQWEDLGSQGWATVAYPINFVPGGTYTTAISLPANGGAIACPLWVPGPMKVSTVGFWNTDTATAREWEVNIYLDDNRSATAWRADYANDFGSATPTAADFRYVSYATNSPVYLPGGVVWIVLRNSSTTQTLGVGSLAASGTFNDRSSHQTKTLAAYLGDANTLDLATGWTKGTAVPALRLLGRVLGQSTAW